MMTDPFPGQTWCTYDPKVCSTCYQQWVTSQLEANGWSQLKCPNGKRVDLLTYETMQSQARAEVFAQYDSFSALNLDLDFRLCRASGCTSGQIHIPNERYTTNCLDV
jgi:hypothetical protein